MKNGKHPVTLPPFTVKRVVATLSQTVDWGLINLNIPDTWSVTKGKGITVLVIDTGCPCKSLGSNFDIHPDLKRCIDLGKCQSFIPDEGIEDLQGHSSHCCGIIGARNNEIGCVGYAPECTVVTYKALNKYGSGTMEQITAALEYAADVLKPDVVSMSLGSTVPYEPMHRAIQKLYKMNIPVIAAGGNGGEAEGVNFPGQYKETITIGAYDVNNAIAYFSAVGDRIDFAFPGVDVYSTYLNNGYAKLSGTCLRGSSLVYTDKGPKQIKDMERGDIVYCLDEKNLDIKKDECVDVIDNGYKQLFKITTDHNTIYATDNHPFLIMEQTVIDDTKIRKKYKRELKWEELRNLKENEYVCTFKQINIDNCNENIKYINDVFKEKHDNISKLFKTKNSQHQIPINAPVLTKEMCQFIGAYIGDGYIHKDKRNINGLAGIGLCIRYGYNQQNIDMPNKYNELFYRSFGLNMTERNNGDLFICSTYMANLFNEIGLGGNVYEKRLPEWCFELPKEMKIAIIAGIIDSDGWITKRGYMGLHLCNLSLLQDIVMLLESIGIKCSNIKTKKQKGHGFKNNGKEYLSYYFNTTQIAKISNSLNTYDNVYRNRLNKKQIFEKINYKYASNFEKELCDTNIKLEKIRKIEPCGMEKVYDITVKNHHNFISDGLIVHNSMATPACAGVVALLIAKHRKQEAETGKNDCKTVAQIKEHLKKYSVDVGKIGKDNKYGYGIVDVDEMLKNENCTTPITTTDPLLVISKPKKKSFLEWLFSFFKKKLKVSNIEGFNGVIGNLKPVLDDEGNQKYNTGMLWYRISLFDYTNDKDKLVFKSADGVEYQMDDHFETDGGSIPPCLRLLPFAHLDPFNFTRSYLYHDCAYQFGGLYIKYPGEDKFKFRLMTRKEANKLLSTTLKYDNATKFDRFIINTGIKAGSTFVWDSKRKPIKQREQRKLNKISVYDKNGYLIEYNDF